MEIVPLLHVRDGSPMRGRPGDWVPLERPYPDGGKELVGLARHLSVRFGRVALVDLGTGRTGDADHNLYQKLSKQHALLWVDARPETLEDVLDLFVAGADRVTVRMDRMDPDDLLEVLEMADGEVWLGYPFQDAGDLRAALREVDPYRFLDAGAMGLVLIDLSRAGTTTGPDLDAVAAVPYRDVPIYVAGGVASEAHVAALAEAGVAGALVATALIDDVDGWAAIAKRCKGAGNDASGGGDGDGDGDAPDDDDDSGTRRERPTAPSSASFTVESPASPLPGVLPGSGPRSREDRR